MKPSVRDVVAKAMYDAKKYETPWEHPYTVKNWHALMKREATVAIAAYNKAVRATYTQKIRKLSA